MAKSKANNRKKGYQRRQQDRRLSGKAPIMQSEEEKRTEDHCKGLRKENNLHQSCQDLADQLHESRQNEALLRKYLKTEEQKNEKLQLQIEKLAKKNKYLKNSLLVHRMQLTAALLAVIVLMISAF
ncbi:hypothetical protein QNN00_14340 [Bacillus velezensis]|nr:hypothetical protein [Bacillus velezensis]